MLVKEKEDYEFFKRYFDNNWLQIQACNSFDLNSKDETIEYNEPSHFEGLFYPFFYGTLMVMSVILLFGVVYELLRRKLIKVDTFMEKMELFGPYNLDDIKETKIDC